ncbi:hypothetical protein AB3N59_00075 [Leptospira sp. WS92.C1]
MKKNLRIRGIGLNLILCFFFFTLGSSLFSQTKPVESKDSNQKETKKIESSRELIETGKLESTRKKAYLALKGIRISLLNFGKKHDLDKLTSDYGRAETQYLRAEYSAAADLFEEIYKTIGPLAETIRKDYETKTLQLGQELAPLIVNTRLDQKSKNRNLLSVFEKYYVRSGETAKASVNELEKGNQTGALYYQKQALISLYQIKILLGKNEDLSVSLSDKISKNRILETDYLKQEELIYWDDSLDRLNVEQDEERKKERVKTLKSYEWKLGLSSGKLQKESESKTQTPSSGSENSAKPK